MQQSEFFERYKYDVKNDYLGGGGFGKVYKAYDDYRGRTVAIKVAEVRDGYEHLSLKNEVRINKELPDHKNICHYERSYRFEQKNGIYDYGILQYYKDGNLSDLINKAVLTLEQKMQIAQGVIEGLKFLHHHEIIHRDLKSSNILIHKRDEEYIPKIADFGVSKKFTQDAYTYISTSFVGGSIAYSAPELLKNEKIRKNLDIWSLGVVLYELFTGELPFTSDDTVKGSDVGRLQVLQKITAGFVPIKIDEVPAPFNEVVSKSLVVDPGLRLKSVDEILTIIGIKEVEEYEDITESFIDKEEVDVIDYTKTQFIKTFGKTTITVNEEDLERISPVVEEEVEEKPKRRGRLIVIFFSALILSVLLAFVTQFLKKTEPQITKFGSKYYFLDESGNPISRGYDSIIKDRSGIFIASFNDSIFHYNEKGALIDKQIKSVREKDNDIDGRTEIVSLDIDSEKKETALRAEEDLWSATRSNDDIADYEQFILNYPNSRYAPEAKQIIDDRINALSDNNEIQEWNRTKDLNSINALERFVDRYPKSNYINEALNIINEIKIANEKTSWNNAETVNTLNAFTQYLAVYPDGIYKDKAEKSINLIYENLASKLWKEQQNSYDVGLLNDFKIKYPKFSKLNEVNQRIVLINKINNEVDRAIVEEDIKELNSIKAKYPKHPKIKKVEAILQENKTKIKQNKEIKEVAMSPLIVGIEQSLIDIAPSTYTIGCRDCGDRSNPKKINIGKLKFSKHEVTNQLYSSIMGKLPIGSGKCRRCPVSNVSLYDARRFLEKLNSMPGNPYTYRLPYEHEWEYAAKGGRNVIYGGSNTLGDVANYQANSKRKVDEVGNKKPNGYGLYDMSGNVYEWTETWYDEEGYVDKPSTEYKVIKGGGFNSKSDKCEIEKRSKLPPNEKNSYVGFRIVRELK